MLYFYFGIPQHKQHLHIRVFHHYTYLQLQCRALERNNVGKIIAPQYDYAREHITIHAQLFTHHLRAYTALRLCGVPLMNQWL